LRVALTGVHSLVKGAWFVRRPRTFGAHAIALTPENRIILVKLRYAPGWRVPGGGRAAEEDPVEAALRELREEIGMISHGDVKPAREFEEGTHFKRDIASLIVVRDVRYRPKKWSWEVEKLCETGLDSLPDDMSPISARWIKALRPLL
jgi:8-oxo-dGTP pyrophosphatase MutT (NUDIX family)